MTTARYSVARCSVRQLLAAAHDAETRELPDLAPVRTARGPALVAWRDAAEPIELREAGAAELLAAHAMALDRLCEAGLDELPENRRRRMTAALRENPAGVIRLLDELRDAGMKLGEFLDLSVGRLSAGMPPSRDTRRRVWADRAIAKLTRLGYAWNERRATLMIEPLEAARLIDTAEIRLTVLGQPIAIVEHGRDSMTFIATARAGAKGPPLHAHEAVDQFELLTAGSLAFTLGPRRVRLDPGEWLPVGRMVPHTFEPIGTDAVITSVVQGAGAASLMAFFEAFDGTPDPEALSSGEADSLLGQVRAAYPRFGIRDMRGAKTQTE